MNNKKEYILCAAILRKEVNTCHKVYWPKDQDIYKCEIGWRHGDILHRFRGIVSMDGYDQGFYTSKGRYLNRDDARTVAKEAGQIPEDFNSMLMSEDLY